MEFKSNVAAEEGPGLISTGNNQNHWESREQSGFGKGTRESELVLYLWNITTNKKLEKTMKGLEISSWKGGRGGDEFLFSTYVLIIEQSMVGVCSWKG